MGLIGDVIRVLFGGRGNVVRETAEVFRENAEAASARDADLQMTAIEAFAAEFAHARRGRFDRFMDALNRVPRPALALSTLGLFAAAMVDPVWFADRMLGITLVPEPLWWLMGAIVSFYFGARQQVKGQEFQRSIAEVLVRANDLRATADPKEAASLTVDFAPLGIGQLSATVPANMDISDNAALKDWKVQQDGK
ncbi:holin family protein [uncultured Aliiroseovarius sp.]|uniref:holin family protein n=1 Tax=uncultured Aliiroseovarius sp. TaxID=1658783 RepID=UPI00262248D1|nr:holin family protein [uncultured Aliiroseovarius sp.]